MMAHFVVKPTLVAEFAITSKQVEIANIMPHSGYVRQEPKLPRELTPWPKAGASLPGALPSSGGTSPFPVLVSIPL